MTHDWFDCSNSKLHICMSLQKSLSSTSTTKATENFYTNIFSLGKKLTYLSFSKNTPSESEYSLSFHGLPSNICHSSTLIDLKITVLTFDDCLLLLDGRLPQLCTF
ncbi:unnamed protein product [Rotaria magnacalcarata]|uniref:Uncharacterized protein n=1 Tax=Rotaria magnacalcarata TaxID=392030 RepID=A0A819UD62_9BILA|nr:unnamed protein product [Rotaria magnacalcarata]CAF4158425.1 unnamed protein product [Rotaria magnacalcarata]